MVVAAKNAGVKRFVYASSSSVYGVSRLAGRDRGASAGAAHALQQVQGHVRAAAVQAPVATTSSASTIRPATVCGYSPRTRLDLSVNILTNHAVNKRQDHRVRRRAEAPEPAHPGHGRRSIELMLRGAAREDRRRDLQRRLPEPCRSLDIAQMVKKVVEEEMPEKGADRDRHHADQRHPLLSRQLRQDRARARLRAEAHDRGCRARSVHAPSATASCRTASTTTATSTSARMKKLQARMSARARSPSSPAAPASSAATWSICCSSAAIAVRVIDNLVGGREREPRAPSRRIRDLAFEQRDIRELRARTTPLFARRRLRLPLRRHRRHRAVDRAADRSTCRPTCRARCTCSSARAHAGVAQVRLRRLVVVLRPGRGADARGPSDRAAVSVRAVSKYQGEQAVFHWHQVYRLPVNSIRIFNAYGTRSRTSGAYGAVFGVFLRAEARRQAVHRGRRRHADARFPLRHRRRRALSCAAAETEQRGRDLESRRRQSAVGQPAGRAARRRRSCTSRSGRASRTAPGPTSRKITRELGWKPQVSLRGGRRDASLPNIDYWREAPLWDPDVDRQGDEDWFEYSGERRTAMMDDASRKIVSHKIKTPRAARRRRSGRVRASKKVIMCHGTFDIVHPGPHPPPAVRQEQGRRAGREPDRRRAHQQGQLPPVRARRSCAR